MPNMVFVIQDGWSYESLTKYLIYLIITWNTASALYFWFCFFPMQSHKFNREIPPTTPLYYSTGKSWTIWILFSSGDHPAGNPAMCSLRVSTNLMTHNQSIHDHGVDSNGLSGTTRWQTWHSVEVLLQVLYMPTKEEGLPPLDASPSHLADFDLLREAVVGRNKNSWPICTDISVKIHLNRPIIKANHLLFLVTIPFLCSGFPVSTD